jgi:hypothetical protein
MYYAAIKMALRVGLNFFEIERDMSLKRQNPSLNLLLRDKI